MPQLQRLCDGSASPVLLLLTCLAHQRDACRGKTVANHAAVEALEALPASASLTLLRAEAATAPLAALRLAPSALPALVLLNLSLIHI